MTRRGAVLLAVLVLIVLGAAVAAATLGVAERATMGARSTGDALDRLLRVRSGLLVAERELVAQREDMLAGVTPSLDPDELGPLESQVRRVAWSGQGGLLRGIGASVPVEPATPALERLAAALGVTDTHAPAWEPEVGAVRVGEPRGDLETALAGALAAAGVEAVPGAVVPEGATRGEAVRALLRQGPHIEAAGLMLDLWSRSGEPLATGRLDINLAPAERLVEAGLTPDDAEALVRARDRVDRATRAGLLWPLAADVVRDRDAYLGALDGFTTRTMQWRVGVESRSDDGVDPDEPERATLRIEGVLDLAQDRPRWVAVALREPAREVGEAGVIERDEDPPAFTDDALEEPAAAAGEVREAVAAPSWSPLSRFGGAR